MAKCYYCGGAGCSQCRKVTSSSYGADAVAKTPSPNGLKILFEETDKVEKGRTFPPLKDVLKKFIPRVKDPTIKKKKYGFTSKQAMKINGGSIYSRPDGSEVLVAFVGDDPHSYDGKTGFTDIVCIGEVVDWIRKA